MQLPTKGDSEIVIVYYQPNLDILSNFSVVCVFTPCLRLCAPADRFDVGILIGEIDGISGTMYAF